MSAPHSIGRQRNGVANVLSTISGSSWSCATAAIGFDVEHVAARVADGLAVEGLGVVADGRLPRVGIVGIDPRQFHRHLAQQVLELVDRPAVQSADDDTT